MPCHCTFPKAMILPTLFVLSQCYLFVTRKPTEAETKAFFHFTTVEVGSALFLYNWWTLIPVAIIGALPLWPAWYIAMGALALIGWINALRFTFYYYVSLQYPAITAAVTAAFAELPAGLSWFVPVCTTAGGCDWYKDLHVNPMTLLWWDDALWLLLVSVIFVTIEGLRYRVSTTRIVWSVLALAALGWDTVIPLWLLYLRTLELRFAESGEEKRNLGRFTWLYVVLAMCAVCSWWPALLEWAVTRGTVAGQFDDGLVLPAGARATLLILMTFFTWGAYFCADTKVGSGVSGTILSYAMKYGILCLLMGHVAGAVSIVLIYREMCPHSTLVPHRLPDTTMPDHKPDAADADRDTDQKKKA